MGYDWSLEDIDTNEMQVGLSIGEDTGMAAGREADETLW